jgi:hypothetical protein
MRAGERAEKRSAFLGVMAKLVAEHPETAGRVAEALGGFGGREFFDEEGAEGFILAMDALVGGEEEGSGLGIC